MWQRKPLSLLAVPCAAIFLSWNSVWRIGVAAAFQQAVNLPNRQNLHRHLRRHDLPLDKLHRHSLLLHESSSSNTDELANLSDEEWQQRLTPQEYNVLRQQGTEPPNSSRLNDVTEAGIFVCAACRSPLFATEAKFESGTGWPSFVAPVSNTALDLNVDMKLLLPRTECACANCGGHMGHVFDDGPADSTTGQRFCINGVSMKFVPETPMDGGENTAETKAMLQKVAEAQENNPYRLTLAQVMPSLLFNIAMGGIFFNSYLMKMGVTGFGTSPIDGLPLLPALYFGSQAYAIGRRLV